MESKIRDHLVEEPADFSMLMQKKSLKVMFSFALLFVVFLAQAQQEINVKGTVIDEAGDPIPGVSILEKGTTHGMQAAIQKLHLLLKR